MRHATIIVGILMSAACTLPTEPSRVDVDRRVEPAWRLLLATPGVGAWAATVPVRSIVVAHRMYHGFNAETLSGGVIRMHTQAFDLPIEELAAILAHELRHVEGYQHAGPNYCDPPGVRGSWALHIETLEALGRHGSAAYLREHYICQ